MRNILYSIILLCLIFTYGCDNDNDESFIQEPIKTSYVEVDSVFSSKVIFGGEIIELPKNVNDHGFVFGESDMPSFETDSVISLGKPDFSGDFFEIKSGLKPGIRYYIRAYLKTDKKVYYGSSKDFNMTIIKKIIPEGCGRLDTITIQGVNFASKIEDNIIKVNDTELELLSLSQGMFVSEIKAIIPYEINLGEHNLTIQVNDVSSEYGEKFIVDPYIKIPDFPGSKRNSTVAFEINGLFYFGTGYDENNNYTSDFYCYNHSSQTWKKITDFPGEKRSEAAAFTINEKAYVGLGKNDDSFFKDFYEFDPATQNWTLISEFPGEERSGSVTFSIDDKAYVMLGRKSGFVMLYDFYYYHPQLDIWHKLNNFTYPQNNINNISSFSRNQNTYLLLNAEIDSKLFIYNVSEDSWNEIDDPDFWASPISFVLNDEIYNFESLKYYNKKLSSWWESYFFKHRENMWFDVGISNNQLAIVGLNREAYSNKLWIFNP